ncbi:hypothetical protein AMS68_001856 [Peltaster fructicola]|uniref:Ricin B lectin domain-containing protein n=1 Tax=Peltaster fructicola TaxID=286661 RepID=A0A6H0XNY4_9PEZI|nr:hypothetical protein AMS68_001856 [Peltaster fructicola]
MPPAALTTGSGYLLSFDNSNNTLQLDSTGSDALTLGISSVIGLSWTIATSSSSDVYSVCTTSSGKSYCLDIINNDSNGVPSRTIPHLSIPSYASGQQWSFSFAPGGSGGYRLSNAFTGSGWYLGVHSDTNQVYMTNNTSEDLTWKVRNMTDFVSIKPATVTSSAYLSSTYSISSTSMASTATSGVSSTAQSVAGSSATGTPITGDQSSSSNSAESLSSGVKIGIGVGAAIVALIILALSVALLMMRRRARAAASATDDNERDNPHSASILYGDAYAKVELCGQDQRVELDGDMAPGELKGDGTVGELDCQHGLSELRDAKAKSIVHVAELPAG